MAALEIETFAALIKGVRLGVNGKGLQLAIEQLLKHKPVWPKSPRVQSPEAVVFIVSKSLRDQLVADAESKSLRVHGELVTVSALSQEQLQEWISDLVPGRDKHADRKSNPVNPAPNSNIMANIKKQKREQRKLNKQKQKEIERHQLPLQQPPVADVAVIAHGIDAHAHAADIEDVEPKPRVRLPRKVRNASMLCDFGLPYLGTKPAHIITWYRYKIFVDNVPNYQTFDAENSYKLQSHWEKIKGMYLLNPVQAERSVLQLNLDEGELLIDLVEKQVELPAPDSKRCPLVERQELVGELIAFGLIKFKRYFEETCIFAYDRRSGYLGDDEKKMEPEVSDEQVREIESKLQIGDKVVFRSFYNCDETDDKTPWYDVVSALQGRREVQLALDAHGGAVLNTQVVAFDVRLANAEELEEITGTCEHGGGGPQSIALAEKTDEANDGFRELEKAWHPAEPCDGDWTTTDPCLAGDFIGQRVEGLVIALHDDENKDQHNCHGLIVCYPYTAAERATEPMTLLLHTRFMTNADDVKRDVVERLAVNMRVIFSISVNPQNMGQGLYAYVATRVVLANEAGFTSARIPSSSEYEPVERRRKGRILVGADEESSSARPRAWIYDAEHDSMHRYALADSDDARLYTRDCYVRFNVRENTEHDMVAQDVFVVDRVPDLKALECADNFLACDAKVYVQGRRIKPNESRNAFNRVVLSREQRLRYSDVYMIVEESEHFINAFLNSGGGHIFFGVDSDGTVVGVRDLSENKRKYIHGAIEQRLSHFSPTVRSSLASVSFVAVCDSEGYTVPDAYVVAIQVLELGGNGPYCTASGAAFVRTGGSGSTLQRVKPSQIRARNREQERELAMVSHAAGHAFKGEFVAMNGAEEKEQCRDRAVVPPPPPPPLKLPANVQHLHQQVQFQHKLNMDNDVKQHSDDDDDDDCASDSGQTFHFLNDLPPAKKKVTKGRLPPPDSYQQLPEPARDANHGRVSMPAQDVRLLQNSSNSFGQQRVSHVQLQPNHEYNGNNIAAPPPKTTIELNALPIPLDDDSGIVELRQRVVTKRNEMLKIGDYTSTADWMNIQTVSANQSYRAQETVWKAMIKLETDVITQKIREAQLQHERVQTAQQQEARKAMPYSEVAQLNDDNRFNASPLQQQHNAFEFNENGYISDKSVFKKVAMEWCQKMGWSQPQESTSGSQFGYRASVTFGPPEAAATESGEGRNKKVALYIAYEKLVPQILGSEMTRHMILSKVSADYRPPDSMRFRPLFNGNGNRNAAPSGSGGEVWRSAKSLVFEYCTKRMIRPPESSFNDNFSSMNNVHVWTATVSFNGTTVSHGAMNKKQAETKCFQDIYRTIS